MEEVCYESFKTGLAEMCVSEGGSMTAEEAKRRILVRAAGEVGTRETGENITEYASAYDFDEKLYGFDMSGLPWCDYFVDWLFMVTFGLEIGSAMTYQYSGCSGASCAASASYYRQRNAFYSSPEVGDQIFFYYGGDINHTGIVESVSGGFVTTIEGNSSDAVRRNQYRIGDPIIAGFGRPRWEYAATLSDTESDPSQNRTEEVSDASGGVEGQSILPDRKIAQSELKMGSAGWAVTAVQSILNYYGYDLDADGEFGVLTRAAVMDWQRAHTDEFGAPLSVDGVVGPKTWRSFYV